jgi:7,8-dihydroneopterin aldolase/epimerase/oxygenase
VNDIDTITITGLTARGYHGVFPEERENGQDFIVDVKMSVAKLTSSDDLDSTIDYGHVADLVVTVIESGPFQLIETVANEIAARILGSQPLAESVAVTVHKPDAPIAHAFNDVAVTINRSR